MPVKRGSRYFYSRKPATSEKAIWYWREGADGAERLLLDPNTLSPDGTISVGVVAPAWDGRLVAFSLKERGADAATLHIMETDSGRRLPDTIPGARYAYPEWTPDGRGFYYTWIPTDPAIPVDRLPGYAEVRFHAVGTDAAADPVVHPRTDDPTSFLGVSLSRDGRWLLVSISHGWVANDVYFKDLRAGDAAWRTLVEGVRAQFAVVPYRDLFFVNTDEGAPRGRVAVADPARPERAAWREVVPEREDAALQAAQVVGGRLVLSYLRNAASAIRIHDLDGRYEREVALPGIGSASGFSGNEDEDEAYFSFSSFTFPPRSTAPASPAARRACGRGSTSRSIRRASSSSRSGTPRRTGRRSRCSSCIAGTWSGTGTTRACSTATADSTSASPRPSTPTPTRGWRWAG